MFRALLLFILAAALIGGLGYLIVEVYERYGDDPFMLMVLAVPVVAALAYLLQVVRR